MSTTQPDGCTDPDTVLTALTDGLADAVTVGPYRVEYLNRVGRPWWDCDAEYLALVERQGGFRDVRDLSDEWFRSVVEYYGATAL